MNIASPRHTLPGVFVCAGLCLPHKRITSILKVAAYEEAGA